MPVRHLARRADFAQFEKQARELQRAVLAGDAAARAQFTEFHPGPPPPVDASLADAELVLARSYDFPNWPRFQLGARLFNAILDDDVAATDALLAAHPELLFERVNGTHSNWGPPLALAAQLDRCKVFSALIGRVGQDLSFALGRAVLKGRTELARQLLAAGAAPEPGEAMGPCENLNVEGLRFLAAIGMPITDAEGDALAPLGMLLQTYARDPEGKHACIEFLVEQGIAVPDTPAMALHRGRIDLLDALLERDGDMVHRRFTVREVYPREAGCNADVTCGLHGTPLDGTTLLHMSLDFDEIAIARWLLAHGALVDARAELDADGFGGQTPLFHAVVSQAWRAGRQRDGAFAELLLDAGTDVSARASIRKAIRFVGDDKVYETRDATPVGYGRAFHHRDWVSTVAIERIAARGGS